MRLISIESRRVCQWRCAVEPNGGPQIQIVMMVVVIHARPFLGAAVILLVWMSSPMYLCNVSSMVAKTDLVVVNVRLQKFVTALELLVF